MKITYLQSSSEWIEFVNFIESLIEDHNLKKICDIGGGANPLLPLSFIMQNTLDYSVIDISSDELSKAPKEYNKIIQNIESEIFILNEQYDLVFTKMMAEHIKNGVAYA